MFIAIDLPLLDAHISERLRLDTRQTLQMLKLQLIQICTLCSGGKCDTFRSVRRGVQVVRSECDYTVYCKLKYSRCLTVTCVVAARRWHTSSVPAHFVGIARQFMI